MITEAADGEPDRERKVGRPRRGWTRTELMLAFNLYCRVPFGRIHKGSPEIIQLAARIVRSPSAVAMKLVNFASLDPFHQRRAVRGLKHASKQDREIWEEFHDNWEELAIESQEAWREDFGKYDARRPGQGQHDDVPPTGPTETEQRVRVRLVQGFFRDSVLSNYRYACTICELSLCAMLNASHIVPWAIAETRRGDPRNGLCLCTFHDKAFDRGLITVDGQFRIVLSRQVKIEDAPKMHRTGLLEIEGQKIHLPDKFGPDPSALAFHRTNIFVEE